VNLPEEKVNAVYHYWLTMAGSDFRDVLKTITVPTAIIYANPGSGYYPATAEFIHSQIPNSILRPMPDCSHMLASEKPQLFIKYLLDFAVDA
jgi:pimeloyl-ACP methyl ester carboxylesterase